MCVGEGEDALLELADAMEEGRNGDDIANLWFKHEGRIKENPVRPLKQNLDELPFPDKSLFSDKGVLDPHEYNLMAGRGCPFRCSYCGNNMWRKLYRGKGAYARMRGVDSVIREALWAGRRFSPKVISFYADIFTHDHEWLEEFCGRYGAEVKIPFFALSHPLFMNDRVARMLKAAGCLEVTMGVESAIAGTRKRLLLRPESDRDIERAVHACKDAGLKVSLDQIVNLPHETEQDMRGTVEFYNRLRPDSMNVYPLQYFPGTGITRIAHDEGILDDATLDRINRGRESSSIVVGVGGKDSFDPDNRISFFRSLLTVIPLLPAPLVAWLVKKRIPSRLTVPMTLFALLKIICKLRVHRGYVYWGIIRDTLRHCMNTAMWKLRPSGRRPSTGTSRTLLLITPFFPPNMGGVETRLQDLNAALTKRGHRVVVLTYQPITTGGRGAVHETAGGVEIWRLPWPGGDLFHRLLKRPVLEALYVVPGLAIMALCFMCLRGGRIDSVHTAGFNAAAVGRIISSLWKRPWVVSTHSIYGLERSSRMARMVKMVLRGADHVITVSEPSKTELIEVGLDPSRISTQLTWVDQERFSPGSRTDARKTLGIPEEAFAVLFVGRFLAIKGVNEMIETARQWPGARFLFVGDGPCAPAVKKAARELPNVTYAGRIPHGDLPVSYRAADAFVMPSRYRESLGRVAVEALSCGTATVVSDRCVLGDMLDDSAVLRVRPEPEHLLRALKSLACDVALREGLGRRGRHAAERLFGEGNVDGFIRAYGWNPGDGREGVSLPFARTGGRTD